MITAITIENFKGIRERVRLELKPITLLFGANSAGKSTILQSLHLAAEVLVSRTVNVDRTTLGGSFVQLGGFRNFVHNHDLRKIATIRLEMQFEEDNLLSDPDPSEEDDALDGEIFSVLDRIQSAWVEFSLGWEPLSRRPYVTRYAVGLNGEPIAQIENRVEVEQFEIDPEMMEGGKPGPPVPFGEPFPKHTVFLVDVNKVHPLLHRQSNPNSSLLNAAWFAKSVENVAIPDEFELWQVDALPEWNETINFREVVGRKFEHLISVLMVSVGRAASDELERFRYLGPLRSIPAKEQSVSRPEAVWASGLEAWQMLTQQDWNASIARINEWLDVKLKTGVRVKVREIAQLDLDGAVISLLASGHSFQNRDALVQFLRGSETRRELVLVNTATGLELNPTDLGVGISQLFPVVVAAVIRSSLTAIEQPELHLHPALQCEIGDLLIEASARRNEPEPFKGTTMIVETHSEHLILRILRRIRETTRGQPHNGIPVTPDDVAVIYVSQEDGQSVPRTIPIDEHGEFTVPWPDDFFESDFYERIG